MSDELGPYFKTSELADLFKITARSVQRYIKSGDIEAIEVGGGYRVHEKEVQKFAESRKVGKKKMKK